jgi:hypothetical protein
LGGWPVLACAWSDVAACWAKAVAGVSNKAAIRAARTMVTKTPYGLTTSDALHGSMLNEAR